MENRWVSVVLFYVDRLHILFFYSSDYKLCHMLFLNTVC